MAELTLALYVFVTVAATYCGVHTYKRWINHITIYGIIWGAQVTLFQMRLIKYPDLSLETITLIFGAWLIFILASLTFRNFYSYSELQTEQPSKRDYKLITIAFAGLALIGAVGVAQHWMALLRMFGSVGKVVLSGNLIYSITRHGFEIPGAWNYVNALNLSADFMGGYFAGQRRRWAVLGVIPFLFEVVYEISAFGRSRIIVGAILWGVAFFLPQTKHRSSVRKSLLSRVLMLTFIIVIFIFGMEFVRAFRGGHEAFTGQTSELAKVEGIGFITPSIYLYVSGNISVLNKFLDYQFAGNTENTPVGGYTFAPVYRFLAKFGVIDPMPVYEKVYAMPTRSNTGTYLRELYDDWGLAGTLIFVYLLGAVCSVAYEGYRRRKSLLLLAVVAYLYVIVFFTFELQPTAMTDLSIGFVGSAAAAIIVDKSVNRKGQRA